jgi:hypothetical protein
MLLSPLLDLVAVVVHQMAHGSTVWYVMSHVTVIVTHQTGYGSTVWYSKACHFFVGHAACYAERLLEISPPGLLYHAVAVGRHAASCAACRR